MGTIEYLRKDKYFPKYLHVLTRKDGDSIEDEEEKWEGHLKKLQREMKNNTKEMTEKMEKEMLEMKTELKEQMENNPKEMSEKIENNSKEMKEDMKDLESKLDQILELLSKAQNPD